MKAAISDDEREPAERIEEAETTDDASPRELKGVPGGLLQQAVYQVLSHDGEYAQS